mgnify:FL=1
MQLDDINIFDSKPPTPEEILAAGPGATATPIDPYERFQQERSQLSLDPVKRTLQRAGQGLGSLFAVDTPLDYALSGLAAAKPVVAAGKGLVTLAHGTTKDAAKQIEKEGAITPKLGSYVEDMYIKRGDYKDVDPFDYPPQASYFSTADNPASSISAMEAQIGYKLGKNIDEPISLKEIEDHGAIVLSDANPKYVFKMDEDDFMPYDLLGNPQSIDAPMGFEANDIVSFLPQEPKKILQGKQLVNFVKKNRGEDRGIAALDFMGKGPEPKDLVFVHNTSEEAIKSFDAMGGIPSPSIAVTKGDESFTGFGNIQLIGKPEKFDPLIDPRNKIYSADAYTPRAPKKIRLAKPGAAEQLAKDYINADQLAANRNVYNRAIHGLEKLNKTRGANYLENQSANFEEFLQSTLAKRKFAGEKGLGDEVFDDYGSFKDFSVNQDFAKWKAKERDKYLSQDGVLQYFDEAKETMVTKPYTLENAVNSMIKETQRGGESASTAFGPGSMRALMSREFADLPDIKSETFRLSNEGSSNLGLGSKIGSLLDDYDFPDVTDTRAIGVNMLNDIGIALSDGKKFDEDLLKNVYNQNIDFDDIEKYTSTAGFEYGMPPRGFLDDLKKIFVENAEGHVKYFEAKPTRAVGFDEFAGAIVPDDTSKEVINILEKRGLKVLKETDDDIENMAFDAGEMATNLRQKHFKEQFFSMAPIAAGASATAMMEEEDRGIGSL